MTSDLIEPRKLNACKYNNLWNHKKKIFLLTYILSYSEPVVGLVGPKTFILLRVSNFLEQQSPDIARYQEIYNVINKKNTRKVDQTDLKAKQPKLCDKYQKGTFFLSCQVSDYLDQNLMILTKHILQNTHPILTLIPISLWSSNSCHN